MASEKRVARLNSLLQEVISEVIRKDVKDPHIHPLTSIVNVEITRDLRQAKVYISVLADESQQNLTIEHLNLAANFIAVNASKKVVLRFFPQLKFIRDTSVDKQIKIETLINDLQKERDSRSS